MVYYNRFLKRWIFDAIDYFIIGWLIGWMVGHQLQRRYGSITSTATPTTPGMIVGSTTFGQQQQYHADILTLPWEEDKLTSNIDEGEEAKERKRRWRRRFHITIDDGYLDFQNNTNHNKTKNNGSIICTTEK